MLDGGRYQMRTVAGAEARQWLLWSDRRTGPGGDRGGPQPGGTAAVEATQTDIRPDRGRPPLPCRR